METSINQRIETISDKCCNSNISELARIIGVNQPALRDIVGAKQSKPGFEILNKIVDNSTLMIDGNWLLTGNGNMFKEEHNKEIVQFVDNNFLLDRLEKRAIENYELRKEVDELKNNLNSKMYTQNVDTLTAAEPKNK